MHIEFETIPKRWYKNIFLYVNISRSPVNYLVAGHQKPLKMDTVYGCCQQEYENPSVYTQAIRIYIFLHLWPIFCVFCLVYSLKINIDINMYMNSLSPKTIYYLSRKRCETKFIHSMYVHVLCVSKYRSYI